MSELEASMIIHVCLHRLVVLIRFLDSAAFGFSADGNRNIVMFVETDIVYRLTKQQTV